MILKHRPSGSSVDMQRILYGSRGKGSKAECDPGNKAAITQKKGKLLIHVSEVLFCLHLGRNIMCHWRCLCLLEMLFTFCRNTGIGLAVGSTFLSSVL